MPRAPIARSPAPRPLGRGDLAASLVLIFPLYLAYAIGILFAPAVNGVDFVSRHVWALCGHDRGRYLALHAVIAGGFLIWVRHARRGRSLGTDVALPLIGEAALYAVSMGALIRLVMDHVLGPVGVLAVEDAHLGATGERVVTSLGAGVHEELVFRLGLMAGSAYVLMRAGTRPRVAISCNVTFTLS